MHVMVKANSEKKVIELEQMKKTLEIQLQEMTKTVAMQQEIIAMSRRDPLTGLRNRAGVSEQINNILKNKCEGAFFIMDMDNFKSVNDTYGHIEGDKVLVRFSKALKKAVDAEDLIARLGGDEFIIFSPNLIDKGLIKDKARRIVMQIERELVTPGRLVKVTISVGISVAPSDAVTYEALYDNADKALYCVKNEGKNSFKLFGDIRVAGTKSASINTKLSLSEITEMLREKKMEGSFMVEYNNFEKIYRFMERNIAREKRDVQCVLFTINCETEFLDDEYALQRHMEYLQHAVASSLRKGDVTTKYSTSQVLALLMDVNKVNAKMVINRIIERYKNGAGDTYIPVVCDIQQVGLCEE